MSKSIHEMINDPKYIVVHNEDRFYKPVARVISKKVLRNIVSEQCQFYKQKECEHCFTDKQELEQPCNVAWTLTIGKGKKVY